MTSQVTQRKKYAMSQSCWQKVYMVRKGAQRWRPWKSSPRPSTWKWNITETM